MIELWPACVSLCAALCGATFLYISTDYVFDGRNPPYGEDDAPNPLNVYGRSKLEGERETLRLCPGARLPPVRRCLTCLPPSCLPPSCPLVPHLSVCHPLVFAAAALILRVPILFGEVESVSESAVTCLWIRVQDTTESCTLDHCQQRFPTDTRDVAAVCRKLCERARQVGCRPSERETRLSVCLSVHLPVSPSVRLCRRNRPSVGSFTSRPISR